MGYENQISFCWRTEMKDMDGFGNPDVCLRAELPTGWSLTVLDRMTGFGYRDIETGLRCHGTGRFWLASGHFDIRDYLHRLNSEDEVIQLVKKRANNCFGGSRGWYPHWTHRELMQRFGNPAAAQRSTEPAPVGEAEGAK